MSAQAVIGRISTLVTDTAVAGISIKTSYDAVGVTVTPPAGTVGRHDPKSKIDPDLGFFDLPDGTRGVTLDSWGSQSRRWSNALGRDARDLSLPLIEFVADFGDGLVLPPNNSFNWSHKHADALFRIHVAQLLDAGIPAQDILAASEQDADALLEWFPQAIVTGWWNSHSGKAVKDDVDKAKKMSMADPMAFAGSTFASKSARAMSSEIIAKGASLRTRYAARVDPVFGAMASPKGAKAKPSELGFGSIPPSAAPKDVTFSSVEGSTWISLTRLRKFSFERHDAERAMTALIVLALAGIRLAEHELHLRSGSDLIVLDRQAWVRRHEQSVMPFELPVLDDLRAALIIFAQEFGWRQERVDLSTSKNLHQLLTLADSDAAEDSA